MSFSLKQRRFLSQKDTVILFENNLVTLRMEDGTVFEKLEPRRLFPVSCADKFITLLNDVGKEIAVIRDMQELNDESRLVLQNSLDDYYLVPFILQLMSVNDKNGTLVWKVKTNRGFKKIEIRNRNHDIRVYPDGRVRVRDADDNRYVIEDYRKLDVHSRRLLMADL